MAEPEPGQQPISMDRMMRRSQAPGHVDQMIRHAIQMCWMVLPAHRKTVDELQTQLQRLLDRAIEDLREDYKAFGYDE